MNSKTPAGDNSCKTGPQSSTSGVFRRNTTISAAATPNTFNYRIVKPFQNQGAVKVTFPNQNTVLPDKLPLTVVNRQGVKVNVVKAVLVPGNSVPGLSPLTKNATSSTLVPNLINFQPVQNAKAAPIRTDDGTCCRLCGLVFTDKKVFIDIFGLEGSKFKLLDKIRRCLPISVEKSDNLPSTVCRVCIAALDASCQFIETALNTNKRLREQSFTQAVSNIVSIDIAEEPSAPFPKRGSLILDHDYTLKEDTRKDDRLNKDKRRPGRPNKKTDDSDDPPVIDISSDSDCPSPSNVSDLRTQCDITEEQSLCPSPRNVSIDPPQFDIVVEQSCAIESPPQIVEIQQMVEDEEPQGRSADLDEPMEENDDDPLALDSASDDVGGRLSDESLLHCPTCKETCLDDEDLKFHKNYECLVCDVCHFKSRSVRLHKNHVKKHEEEKLTSKSINSSEIDEKKKLAAEKKKLAAERKKLAAKARRAASKIVKKIVTKKGSGSKKSGTLQNQKGKNKAGSVQKPRKPRVKKIATPQEGKVGETDTPGENGDGETGADGTGEMEAGTGEKINKRKRERKCPTCDKVYTNHSSYWRHLTLHDPLRHLKHRCAQCNNRPFRTAKSLSDHMALHGGVKLYKCALCPRSYNRRANLNKHKKHHKPNESLDVSCEWCEEKFRKAWDLTIHAEEKHPAEFSAKVKVHPTYPYKTGSKTNFGNGWMCKDCGKILSTKCSLKYHERIHSGIKPIVCEHCGLTFRSPPNYYQHLSVHAVEKKFLCSVCGRKFARKSFIRVHMRTHTGEKPYVCEMCGKQYSQSQDLLNHKRRLHNEGGAYSPYRKRPRRSTKPRPRMTHDTDTSDTSEEEEHTQETEDAQAASVIEAIERSYVERLEEGMTMPPDLELPEMQGASVLSEHNFFAQNEDGEPGQYIVVVPR